MEFNISPFWAALLALCGIQLFAEFLAWEEMAEDSLLLLQIFSLAYLVSIAWKEGQK